MEWYKDINRELKAKYGKAINGLPMYRVIQNLNLSEKRRVEKWVTLYNGIIYRVWDVEELPKYNYIEEGRWVLEQLFNNASEELIEKQTYEPVWVFSKGQNPNLKACIFLIECSRRGPSEVISEDEQIRKEQEEIFEFLGGNATIDHMTADGSGISMAGLDAKSLIKDQNNG